MNLPARSLDFQPLPRQKTFVAGVAQLPTRHGSLRIVSFHFGDPSAEHVAIVSGEVSHAGTIPVRIHSECLTGDVFGSLRCDCRDQLQQAIDRLAHDGPGVILYLRQEGRGIGLTNKVRAYALQDRGLDTVDANKALGFPDDTRDYAVAGEMLQALGVRSVDLLTNNPEKVAQLEMTGVEVRRRLSIQPPANEHNVGYLQTKARRSGHLLSLPELEAL